MKHANDPCIDPTVGKHSAGSTFIFINNLFVLFFFLLLIQWFRTGKIGDALSLKGIKAEEANVAWVGREGVSFADYLLNWKFLESESFAWGETETVEEKFYFKITKVIQIFEGISFPMTFVIF